MKTGVIAAVVLAAAAAGFAVGQTTGNIAGIKPVKLPVPLPAVGNIDAVKKWRFGRVEQISRNSIDGDITIRVRIANGQTADIVGPRQALSSLARSCGWVATETQTVAGRSDYVERMIAFDVDDAGRFIAVMSMEPFNRDRARLRRAFR
jgi:hypothetical protein